MQERETRWKSPEFLLVVAMLVVLTVLVGIVMLAPLPKKDDSATAAVILDYRKSILSIIITAFGAWVGAGAAYFFGRENLREAANSMLAMREPSPKERLRQILIRAMPLKPINWCVAADDDLSPIVKKLKTEPGLWFIPIVKDGMLETVIDEEAIWRFIDHESAQEPPIPYTDILKKTIADVLEYIKAQKLERLREIYVPVTLDKSAGDVYELMQNKSVFLAVVVDEAGKPTHFITTADVRRILLQMS